MEPTDIIARVAAINALRAAGRFHLDCDRSAQGWRIYADQIAGRPCQRAISPRARPKALALWLDGFEEALSLIDDPAARWPVGAAD